MKRALLTLAAVASLVSCAKETEVSSQKDAITFENSFINNSTKSVNDPSFTNSNLFTDFAVYGFVEGSPLFNGTKVSQSITNSDLKQSWKYEGTQYWITGAKYNFCAVAPMTSGGWTSMSSQVNTDNGSIENQGITSSFTFTDANKGTEEKPIYGVTDLLYAEADQVSGQLTNNSPVAFTFNHILSKVKFSFKNGYNASAATLKVKDIKITNAFAKGEVTITGATTDWEPDAGVTPLTLDFGMATDNEATNDHENAEVAFGFGSTFESQNERLIIPNAVPEKVVNSETYTGYNVTFTVELYVNGTYIWKFDHSVYVNFIPEPGKSYDILAEITPANIDPSHAQEPIEFTVDIADWTPATTNPSIAGY